MWFIYSGVQKVCGDNQSDQLNHICIFLEPHVTPAKCTCLKTNTFKLPPTRFSRVMVIASEQNMREFSLTKKKNIFKVT